MPFSVRPVLSRIAACPAARRKEHFPQRLDRRYLIGDDERFELRRLAGREQDDEHASLSPQFVHDYGFSRRLKRSNDGDERHRSIFYGTRLTPAATGSRVILEYRGATSRLGAAFRNDV
jgi:hypothetical protein